MKKKHIHLRPMTENSVSGNAGLIILSCCFLFGALLGHLISASTHHHSGLKSYFDDYFFLVSRAGLFVSPLTVLWNCTRWPLLVAAFSLTSIKMIAVPSLIFLKGVSLSFAISYLCLSLDSIGAVVSLVLFSLAIILELPALFMISCNSFTRCKRGAMIYLLGIGMLVLSTVLNSTVIPELFSAVSVQLLS